MKDPTYKVILFDLFHTLVDVATAPGACGRYTADILGVGRDEWNRACFSAVHNITGPTTHFEIIRQLAHSLDADIALERIVEAVDERQKRFDYALLNIEEEVQQTLQQLRLRGVRLCLVSNASTGEVAAWPDSPLKVLFDEAIFSCQVGCCKPQPQIYHHALACMGVSADEALFVGDGGSNEHKGAREVGLANVLITRYLQSRGEDFIAARRADTLWQIERLPQLLPLLEG